MGTGGPATNSKTVRTSPTFNVSATWDGREFLHPTYLEDNLLTLNCAVNYNAAELNPVTGWTIDWGDGTTSSPNVGDTAGFQHVYVNQGAYTIVATTSDGSYSATLHQDVGYAPAALTVVSDFPEPPMKVACRLTIQTARACPLPPFRSRRVIASTNGSSIGMTEALTNIPASLPATTPRPIRRPPPSR